MDYHILWCMYRLEYNSATNTYGNLSGVEIRVPHFGGDNAFHTYQKLVDYLQDVHGYTNKNVRLAPYDWRLAPRMCNVYRVSHCMYTVATHAPPGLKQGKSTLSGWSGRHHGLTPLFY